MLVISNIQNPFQKKCKEKLRQKSFNGNEEAKKEDKEHIIRW